MPCAAFLGRAVASGPAGVNYPLLLAHNTVAVCSDTHSAPFHLCSRTSRGLRQGHVDPHEHVLQLLRAPVPRGCRPGMDSRVLGTVVSPSVDGTSFPKWLHYSASMGGICPWICQCHCGGHRSGFTLGEVGGAVQRAGRDRCVLLHRP